jgi:hypothetical protein
MVSSNVVFASVVSQVLLTWVPPDIVRILCNFITNPKISHFHRTRFLAFDSVICNTNANGSHVIAMNLYFGLRMPQLFKGHAKNHSFFAIEEEGAKFGLGDRCNDEL